MSAAGAARRRALFWLFCAALALRLLFAAALDTPALAEEGDPWRWGGEAACLAQGIAERGHYADPWGDATGPTSWLTPVYPALLALLMELSGGISRSTAWAVIAVQSAASAATSLLLVTLGRRLGHPRAGWLGGWLFALYPISIWHATATVWDTTLVAFALTGFLLLALEAPRSPRRAALAGLAYGGLLFLNPAPLAILPAVALFLALEVRPWPRALLLGGAFAAPALAVCLPWMVRNQLALGSLALRPNLGVELRIGNNDAATGHPDPVRLHPSGNAAERALYLELGEVGYSRDSMRRAQEWIRGHPGRFAALTARRAQLFWFGDLPTQDPRRDLATGRGPARDPRSWIKFAFFLLSGAGALVAVFWIELSSAQRALLAGSLLLYGLPYFVTHVSERYRFPIDALIVLLDAWLLVRLFWGRGEPAAAGAREAP